MDSISKDEARRIALAAQGFGEPRPRKPGFEDMKRVIRRIKLVQIDSVNVLTRAHYLPFFSRLGPYRREMLDELAYRDQFLFEQWAHMACFVPLADYPLLHHKMANGNQWWRTVPPERLAYFETVLEQIRERGPALTGEMDEAGGKVGWWNWSDAKIALEYHFAHGRLAVRERRNFARVYDLPERVFHPSVLEGPGLPREEAQRQMLRNSLAALGVATAGDLRDYYRLKMGEARPHINDMVDAGEAVPVKVEGWTEQAYRAPGIETAPGVRASALLSPFDNLIWDRKRDERLFDFHYRIEIYTPAPKRVYGYYVLAFMNENAIAARVDLKANRQQSVLQVQAAHLEPGAPEKKTGGALARELKAMAKWLGMERVAVAERGDLAARLQQALGVPAPPG
jgi:uncharacterized protein YcaQ